MIENPKAAEDTAPSMRFQSQRDCVLQPRVASSELPWEIRPKEHSTLKGLCQRSSWCAGESLTRQSFQGLNRLPPLL